MLIHLAASVPLLTKPSPLLFYRVQSLLHSLSFPGEKLHFFSRYYVENSAHFWPFFSVDVTIISIANRQSNNASQQLDRVMTHDYVTQLQVA